MLGEQGNREGDVRAAVPGVMPAEAAPEAPTDTASAPANTPDTTDNTPAASAAARTEAAAAAQAAVARAASAPVEMLPAPAGVATAPAAHSQRAPRRWARMRHMRHMSHMSRRASLAGLAAVVLVATLVAAHAALTTAGSRRGTARAAQPTPVDPYTAGFAGSTSTTAPTFAFSAPAGQIAVDATFADAYAAHGGAALLGAPVTPAFHTAKGWMQFFANGALVVPDEQDAANSRAAVPGVRALDVVPALLAAGSLAKVGGADSTLTYADLRADAATTHLVAEPAADAETPDFFIPEARQGSTVLGHIVPAAIWAYINQPSISPGSWSDDVGMPLTEAVPAVVTRDGAPHHLLVQAFTQAVIALDQDATDPAGQQLVGPVDTGVAYLQTFAPPQITLPAAGESGATATATATATAWATGDTAVRTSPTGGETVHIGRNFPVTVRQGATWVNGALWYPVHWDAPKHGGDGWLPATALTFHAPNGPETASLDVLSADLTRYLDAQGGNAAAAVYDETRGRYYLYGATGAFTMASSAKVPIMVTFLNWTESQGCEPNDYEMYLLTTMIENSNNDSAQALYETVGYDAPIAAYLNSIGVHDWSPNPNGWGWSTLSPLSMVKILTALHDGTILTAQDRQLALNLMSNIEPDQQIGVGDTAPQGASVQMKDGWVPGPDGLWVTNTSGIVTVHGETYIIAVYSQHLDSLDDGWAIVRRVASTVAAQLA